MLDGLRIEQRKDGIYLVCTRGVVAHMCAGYAQTQRADAELIVKAVQNMKEK